MIEQIQYSLVINFPNVTIEIKNI